MLKQTQPIYLMQTDLKWATYPYTSSNNSTQKIASSGCGLVSVNMILREYKLADIYPPYLAELSIKNGFRTKNDGTAWGFMKFVSQQYNIKFLQTKDIKKVKEAIKQKALVICAMGRKSEEIRGYFTSEGHYILLWGYDIENNKFYANDPVSKYRTNVPVDESVFLEECKQYFIFNRPEINNQGSDDIIIINSLVCKKVISVKESLNIRELPNADSTTKVLGKFKNGDVVQVTGKVDDDWLRIDYEGKDAFIHGDFTKDYTETDYNMKYNELSLLYNKELDLNKQLINKINQAINDLK